MEVKSRPPKRNRLRGEKLLALLPTFLAFFTNQPRVATGIVLVGIGAYLLLTQ